MARGKKMGSMLSLRVGTEMDAHRMRVLFFLVPWAVWLVGLPLAMLALRMARKYWHHEWLLSVGMIVITVGLSWLVWRVTAMRKGFGRWHPVLNMACAMGWLTYCTRADSLNGLHGVLYLLGGLAGCIAWNVRNATHGDPVFDVLADSKSAESSPASPRFIDMGYIARAVASRVPIVRDALEGAGKAVPALARPWQAPAIEQGSGDHGGSQGASQNGILEGEIIGVDPKPVYDKIQSNWRKFTTQMPTGRDLNGARLTPVKLSPTRIRTQVLLRPGRQEPKLVEDARGLLAGLMGMPLSSVIPMPNPKNNSRVWLDFVIHDTLAKSRKWNGPQGAWRSIGDAPLIFGAYEDGIPATFFQPANPAKNKNLSHVAFEGMNGSGKSNVSRLAIAEGLLMYDVVDWVIDPKKGRQTMGCVSSALEWFATTEPESVDLIDFVVTLITAKANYLGDIGLDNWEPGCGLPFHRIWIEEGNLVAGILGSSMEDSGNLARSAGVGINGSFQRMHHENVSTGFRAVFPESMSFGVSKHGDAFILPDELAEAGCDPSMWKNGTPGMMYWNSLAVPMDRRIMPVRSFLVPSELAEEVSREYGERKMARVKQEFPDYYELLAEIDTNGVFQRRQTGGMVRAAIDAARIKRMAKKNRASVPVPSGAGDPTPVAAPRTPPSVEEEMDMESPPIEPDETEGADEMNDPLYAEGMKRLNTSPGEFSAELNDLGARSPWDPSDPDLNDPRMDSIDIPIPDPSEVLHFGNPEPDSEAERPRALAFVIAYLANRGPGWKFQPHEVAEECMEHVERSMSWYRQELSTTIPSMGLTTKDQENGYWVVASDIRSERTAQKIRGFLDQLVSGN
jgi:hypothetical protein